MHQVKYIKLSADPKLEAFLYVRDTVEVGTSIQYRADLEKQEEIEEHNNFWLRKLKTSIFENTRYNRIVGICR